MHTRILACTNVGSIGKSTAECSDNNRTVRNNLCEALAKIVLKWGKVDVLSIQECGGFDHVLPPFFKNQPVSSNKDIHYGGGEGDKRGVLTFSNEPNANFDHSDIRNELCITITSYRNKKNRPRKCAIVNCYRNQHTQFGRSSNDTRLGIISVANELRANGIRNVIVFGDFNDEKFNLGAGFRELIDNRWTHRLNRFTACKKIDKAFANFADVGVLDILPSAENKNDDESGHKVAAFWVGAKPELCETTRKDYEICSLRLLKDNCKEAKLELMDIDAEHDDVKDPFFLDKVAKNFTEEFSKLVQKSRTTVTPKTSLDTILLTRLEKKSDQIAFSAKAAKPFYKFMKRVKEGLNEAEEDKAPPLKALCAKLEDKLYNLLPTNEDITMKMVDLVYPVRKDKMGNWPKNNKDFKMLLNKVSNSGAIDYLGMSLKMTKIGLSFNEDLFKRFKKIAEMALEIGHFPSVWKMDQISFLYKRKGSTMDPGNFRPITISPSFGKHLERVMTNFISGMNDMNDLNHAYTAKRSCLTAITDLQNSVRKIKMRSKELKKTGFKLVPVISTDDISGAFESVVHKLVATAIGNSFSGDERKIGELVMSYLDRKCEAKDKRTNETRRIFRRFSGKTTPQGSLISPKLWRIYDALFSKFYIICLEKVLNSNPNLNCYFTVAYADDHVTVLAILVPLDTSDEEISILAKAALLTARELLVNATETFGCRVHPTKSENVIAKKYHAGLASYGNFKTQDAFIWLGYKLVLTNDDELLFDREMIVTRLLAISLLRDSVFQYTANITLKWKIFKTYIAPFIELYLPLVVQEGADKTNTIVHKFQHSCLCKVLGVSFRSSRIKVEKAISELSVKSKAIRMAKRLAQSFPNNDAEDTLKELDRREIGVDATNGEEGRTTRSGKKRLSQEQIMRRDKKKWDYLTKLANLSFEELEEKIKVNLDKKRMRDWVRKINKNNARAIQKRKDDENPAGKSRKKRRKKKS